MLSDAVYCITRNSDSSHTRTTRHDEPHSELPLFCGVSETHRVTGITGICDFDHKVSLLQGRTLSSVQFLLARSGTILRASRTLTNHGPL